MREPLMQDNPRGAIAVGRWPDLGAIGRAAALAAGTLGAITVAIALATALLAGSSSSGRTSPPTIRGRELGISSLPPGATLAVARALGFDDHAFWVHPSRGGLLARDRRSGLGMRFAASGVTLSSAHGTVSLSLVADGAQASLHRAARVTPVARANRVSYRRGGLSEWYANGPLGLEQGLTVASAPDGARGGALRFVFAIAGTLHPRERGGQITFRDRTGATALRYTDLRVTDARGRVLPAGVALRRGRLILRVDAAGARYPVTIDPLLTPSTADGVTSDFGISVASSGTTLVVGAPNAGATDSADGAGAAYVFVEPQTGWQSATQNAVLTASDGQPDDDLGKRVAIATTPSGTTVFAGAPYRDDYAGAVYVFTEPAGGWGNGTTEHEVAQLTAPAAAGATPELGTSLAATTAATSGLSTVVAGAPGSSAAYVYVEPSGGWTSTSSPAGTLNVPSTGSAGASVAIASSPTSGVGTVVVGAPYTDEDEGAADLFVEPPGGWTDAGPTSTLTATDGASYDELGESVAIAESAAGSATVVAGAPDATVSGDGYAGEAYVFVEPATGTWAASTNQAATLESSDPASDDQFGGSVATDGSSAFVSDFGVPNSSGMGSTAGVWEFDESGSVWGDETQPATLTYAGDSSDGDGLLQVQGDPTEFLGQPGNGDVDVICDNGGACPPITTTPRASTSSLACAAATTGGYTCTDTVTDTSGQSPALTPTGTATVAAGSGTFSGSGVCTLSPKSGSAGSASCAVTYTPTTSGTTVPITAGYSGDTHFASSSASFSLVLPVLCNVPNVVHATLTSATTKLLAAHCVLGKVTTAASKTVPKGEVISTAPASGASLKAGTAVAVTVSSGPPVCKVPKLAGDTLASAKTALHSVNCAVGKTTTSTSKTVAKGKVISSTPKSGTSHKVGTKVALVISSGPPVCKVPKLVGDTLASAKTALHSVNCAVGKLSKHASKTVAKGAVISSTPKSGTSHKVGSKVALTVSTG